MVIILLVCRSGDTFNPEHLIKVHKIFSLPCLIALEVCVHPTWQFIGFDLSPVCLREAEEKKKKKEIAVFFFKEGEISSWSLRLA